VHAAAVLLAVLRLTLRLELGAEYDTNANRVDSSDPLNTPIASPLLRTTARVNLAWKQGRNLLQAQTSLGAKAFFNPAAVDQSVIVLQVGLLDRVRLSRRADFTLTGDYYEAFQDLAPSTCTNCYTRRDFRTGIANARLTAFDGPGMFWIGVGYRGFIWKPDENFDFHAPTVETGASVGKSLGNADNSHDLTFSVNYRAERRGFALPRQLRGDDGNCFHDPRLAGDCLIPDPEGTLRVDWFHEMSAELAYVGALLASVGYAAQLNQSNSFGEPLLRHVITLKLAYRLPWEIYATLKAQLMITRYFDPLLLDTKMANVIVSSFEDENRNSIVVDLERVLSKRAGVYLDLRYSFFSNQLSAALSEFRRHVAYLGLTYRFSTR
jgi:hypothetical protein